MEINIKETHSDEFKVFDVVIEQHGNKILIPVWDKATAETVVEKLILLRDFAAASF